MREVLKKNKPRGNARGFMFLDAIFALVILSLGLWGYLTMFSQMTKSTIDDEFGLIASRLAGEEIEQVLAIKAASGYDGVNVGTTTETITQGQYSFTRQTVIEWVSSSDLSTASGSETGYKRIRVTMGWNSGSAQTLSLMSIISDY